VCANNYIFIVLTFIFLSQQTPSYAQTGETPTISAEAALGIDSALQLLTAYNYQAALSQLDKTLLSPNLAPYEKSLLFQMKGQSHYELDQIQETIQAFEDAISAGGLLDDKVQQLRLNIAQLWILQGEYQRGAEMLEQRGRDSNDLKPYHIEQTTQAYIQSNSYERALPWAERWHNEADPKERKHYDLMNFLYNNLGQHEKQIEIIKAMMERWPDDKTLRDSLASIYANDGRERKAFEVHQETYRLGMIKSEHDIILLVQNHSHFEMPYEAARILDEEIEAGRVSNTLKNKVWLSILYQDAGYDSLAEGFFAEAAEMSDKMAAEEMRETLMTPQQTKVIHDFGLLSLYPDFKPPKIDRHKFKIVVSDRDAQPLVRIPPVMPKNAKKSGHCKVRFNVTSVGKPENIVAIFCTEKLFEMPSIKSVEQWKYRPKIVDGRQIARSGVESRVKFLIKDDNGNIVPE